MKGMQGLSGERKYAFLHSMLDKREFLKLIESLECFDENYKVAFDADFKLSEKEFRDIPSKYREKIYGCLNFTEDEASDFNSWFYVNYEAVKKEIIKPYYFACTRNGDGIKNITKALRAYKRGDVCVLEKVFTKSVKSFFGYVKLKRSSGILKNLSFGSAWWKHHTLINAVR
jgi:hypothetical protein